jgi:hypothetical protein
MNKHIYSIYIYIIYISQSYNYSQQAVRYGAVQCLVGSQQHTVAKVGEASGVTFVTDE